MLGLVVGAVLAPIAVLGLWGRLVEGVGDVQAIMSP